MSIAPKTRALLADTEQWLGAPYGVERPPRWVHDDHTVERAARSLMRNGSLEALERMLVGACHGRASRSGPERDALIPDAWVSRRLDERLGGFRQRWGPVVGAAVRAFDALNAMVGGSSEMDAVRLTTWRTCFGHDLFDAVKLKSLIRDHDVLVLGETGTGKELVAQAILAGTVGAHEDAPAPSAQLNAAAVSPSLVAAELFGHVKGAFTGASRSRDGHLRAADGGTIFLDEIGDLPLITQVKLLRVMETNELLPVGADVSVRVDVRYVAATHRDVDAMVERNEFRRDLYERLAGVELYVPPLRERPTDIVDIGLSMVRAYVGDDPNERLVDDAERWLRSAEVQRHAWRGNVRELRNALRSHMLGLEPRLSQATKAAAHTLPAITANSATLRQASDWYLQKVVASCNGNLTQAAIVLAVDRTTLRRRLRQALPGD